MRLLLKDINYQNQTPAGPALCWLPQQTPHPTLKYFNFNYEEKWNDTLNSFDPNANINRILYMLSNTGKKKKVLNFLSFSFILSATNQRPRSIIQIKGKMGKRVEDWECDLGGLWRSQRRWGFWIWIFAAMSSRDIPCMTFLSILCSD
jgi:hypothetical protein